MNIHKLKVKLHPQDPIALLLEPIPYIMHEILLPYKQFEVFELLNDILLYLLWAVVLEYVILLHRMVYLIDIL